MQGPAEAERKRARTRVWGEVKNTKGDIKQAYIETPNGYDVTVYGPLAIMEKLPLIPGEVMEKSGSITPSLLMGAQFIAELPDTSEIRVV